MQYQIGRPVYFIILSKYTSYFLFLKKLKVVIILNKGQTQKNKLIQRLRLYLNSYERTTSFTTGVKLIHSMPNFPMIYADLQISSSYSLLHALRTPNEAFFHRSPELLGLGRQIGQINSGASRVFLAKLSALILVQSLPCPFFPLFNHYFYKKLSLYMHSPNSNPDPK